MDLLVLVEYDIVIEVASLGLNNLFVCDDKQCEQGELDIGRSSEHDSWHKREKYTKVKEKCS